MCDVGIEFMRHVITRTFAVVLCFEGFGCEAKALGQGHAWQAMGASADTGEKNSRGGHVSNVRT